MEASGAATLQQNQYHNLYETARVAVALKEAVLAPLHRGALADGSVHPRVLARWKAEDAYGPVLRAVDVVSPGFSANFDTAAQATVALTEIASELRSWLEGFQQRAAARALSAARGAVEPAEVEKLAGDMLASGEDGAARMRELVRSVASDFDALAGLRKAAIDWIVRKLAGGSAMISFLADNRDTLRELFPHSQVTMYFSVARSVEMDIRRVDGTATATAPTMAFVAVMSLLDIPAALHSERLATSLRQGGIRDVEALYRQMLLDPEFARLMIGKMPRSLESSKWQALTKALRPPNLSHRIAA